jgi:hypothetical protein
MEKYYIIDYMGCVYCKESEQVFIDYRNKEEFGTKLYKEEAEQIIKKNEWQDTKLEEVKQ